MLRVMRIGAALLPPPEKRTLFGYTSTPLMTGSL
jgi:hypothetical protein